MAVYDDVNGWQNKQFLGQGEFTLVFGDYKVGLKCQIKYFLKLSSIGFGGPVALEGYMNKDLVENKNEESTVTEIPKSKPVFKPPPV